MVRGISSSSGYSTVCCVLYDVATAVAAGQSQGIRPTVLYSIIWLYFLGYSPQENCTLALAPAPDGYALYYVHVNYNTHMGTALFYCTGCAVTAFCCISNKARCCLLYFAVLLVY